MKSFDPVMAICQFLGLFVCLTMHQAAKAIAAKMLGDKSPSTTQRATLNPIPHVDILGTIVLPIVFVFMQFFIFFGWAKPLYIDYRYFKKPKSSLVIVYSVGLSFFVILLILCLLGMQFLVPLIPVAQEQLSLILQAIIRVTLILFVFNILPLPGSDMWSIILNVLNHKWSLKLREQEQNISWIVLILFLLESQNIIVFFRPIIHFLMQLIYGLLT